MSRAECMKDSSLAIFPLSSPTSRKAISIFAQLLSSCAGPFGRNHIVRNVCGGHMTITSCSSRILSTISISRSELKLVVSSLSAHLNQYGDAGLFMAHMCLELTKSAIDLDINHTIISSVFSSFVSIIVDYIKNDDNSICVKADFSSVKILLSYIRSILSSKTLLNIQPQTLNDLSLLVLNSFVMTIPSTVGSKRLSDGVYLIGIENQPVSSSRFVEGILLAVPELLTLGQLSEWATIFQSDQQTNEIKVALITDSMSGDVVGGVSNATFEGTHQQVSAMEQRVFQQLTSMCDVLQQESVGLVLCQKVIHPRLKNVLRSKGILFVDRLGLQLVSYISDLTDCHPISSVLLPHDKIKECLGMLTSVTGCNENGKSYIHLENCASPNQVITLLIASEVEERLAELKHCVSSCLLGLGLLVKEPWLLRGGGCWQMQCSYVLKKKVNSSLAELCAQTSCSESDLRRLLSVFRSSLHRWCLGLKLPGEHLSFDPSSLHCWASQTQTFLAPTDSISMQSCKCGSKSMPVDQLEGMDIVLTQDSGSVDYQRHSIDSFHVRDVEDNDDIVLDNMTACLEALHKGVLTSGLLLSIGQFICDKN